MHLLSCAVVLMVFCMVLRASGATTDGLEIAGLRCEGETEPLGVDQASPRLSWQLRSRDASSRADSQSAWRILVASSPDLLLKEQGDLWDSGKVARGQIQSARYEGKTLLSSQKVFWTVRAWDQNDTPGPWSRPATWTMGVLSAGDWKARWITLPGLQNRHDERYDTHSLLLRRAFSIPAQVKRAVVHVSGLGHYEMQLNGRKVGDAKLSPGWTNYHKTVLYDTYDVTDLLKDGQNAVGIILGAGMYHVEKDNGRYTKFAGTFGPACTIVQFHLEFADGSSQTLTSDDGWTVHPGPLTFSHMFGGEDFDARLLPENWSSPGFTDADWQHAVETTGPGGQLAGISRANQPIRTFETFKPISEKTIKPGVIVYDMGQNASIMSRLVVKGPAGSSVRIIPGELLKPDGLVDQASGGKTSWWKYTLQGKDVETYFPWFFYRGSRYQQVELAPAPDSTELPTIQSFETVMLHADAPATGTFSCSNDLFNRTYALVRWAQRSNLFSVMTDCPHREKLGWLEQTYLNGPALRYNFDLTRTLGKTVNDMADAQTDLGMVPGISPEYVKFGGNSDTNAFRNSPEWGSAIILVSWQHYLFTGDTTLLEQHYDSMKRYLAYLQSKAHGHILDFGLGDWYDIGPKHPGQAQLTPRSLTATATYFADAQALSRIARLLGKDTEADGFAALAQEIRAAFNTRFFNGKTGSYSTNSQTANAMPLVLGIVEPEHRDTVLAALVKDVRDRDNAITAGDVGYRYLLRALADAGRSDVVFDLNSRSDRPGYGMQLAHGATALTEAWDAGRASSQNHFMLGQINEWFFHDLAGIQPDEARPGFAHILIQPAVVGDLQHVQATYESPYGQIRSAWTIEQNQAVFEITIPTGRTATVRLPAQRLDQVTEGGHPAGQSPGVSDVRLDAGRFCCEVQSGSYRFEVKK